ncbi:hypothetical protein FJ936_28430 [Mesorhizobium sp. B2-4-13]|uniref:hypothetical protein n=1 Tax=Mesorhizobium sp. B2-4-13 TaxID=2589936 RepID=UPI00115117DE|nr:hypothetical protein [Mesorhizobium sp. B2-4-13]TPK81046.1 hypothetical protein FJ936_28430 [Mesorhizobium sp. B2-4-13]
MAERDPFQTFDWLNGKLYVAPSNAVHLYKEMQAACAIAYQWPNIEPPAARYSSRWNVIGRLSRLERDARLRDGVSRPSVTSTR